ncbi:dynein-associated protein, putative [Plasmodium malariae]|uniref:Dynein-associated protein, putative n=1 Tax=Plasmodium malariae TaxID=5858 RepID=A0A1C3KF89_PLAMA|nr:dynein-associated protein, putative [Plasmodium malariae]
MKDYLAECNKYLKYDNPIVIENEAEEEEKGKNLKDEKKIKDKNIVRIIQEIRKNLKSNMLYKNDNKNVFFNEPIYNIFPMKNIKEKKMEYIFYVSRSTSEDDVLTCLRKINEIIFAMYTKSLVIKKEFLDDLLNVFMELCRQVSVSCFQRGNLLKQLFNYNIMLLTHYHKLVQSSLELNLKKQIKQNSSLSALRNEIEIKKDAINSLKNEIVKTEDMIENEKINSEKELSEVNIIYQNKIDKLKKNNQRKKDDFTRILQL